MLRNRRRGPYSGLIMSTDKHRKWVESNTPQKASLKKKLTAAVVFYLMMFSLIAICLLIGLPSILEFHANLTNGDDVVVWMTRPLVMLGMGAFLILCTIVVSIAIYRHNVLGETIGHSYGAKLLMIGIFVCYFGSIILSSQYGRIGAAFHGYSLCSKKVNRSTHSSTTKYTFMKECSPLKPEST